MIAFLIGFYAGGCFYVGMIAASDMSQDVEPLTFIEVVLSALYWPLGLFRIVNGG